MKKTLISTALTVGLALSGSAVAGALLTPAQTQGFSFSSLNETTQLQFDGFDSNLGALHSVHLSWIMDKSLNNKIMNMNAGDSDIGNPVPISATSTTIFSILGGSIALESINELTTVGFTGSVPGTDSVPGSMATITTVGSESEIGITGSTLICDDSSCLADGGTLVTTAELDFYIGAINLLDVNIENKGSQGGSVPSGVFTGNDGTADGTVTVVYGYDVVSVPEPTTIALLGLGFSLAGLQSSARRRKRAI